MSTEKSIDYLPGYEHGWVADLSRELHRLSATTDHSNSLNNIDLFNNIQLFINLSLPMIDSAAFEETSMAVLLNLMSGDG
jgi:hypothetical protein